MTKILETKLLVANESLVAQAVGFVTRMNDSNVLPRPVDEYQEAVERSLLFAIINDDEAVVAVSGVFDLGGQWANKEMLELGSTLVADEYRGFGLQGLLFAARLAAIAINEIDPSTGRPAVVPISLTKPGNAHSKTSILKTGLQLVLASAVPQAVYDPCRACDEQAPAIQAGRACCCDVYEELLPDPWRTAVRLLVNTTGSIWSRPHRGDDAELRVNLTPFFSVVPRAAVEDFVTGA